MRSFLLTHHRNEPSEHTLTTTATLSIERYEGSGGGYFLPQPGETTEAARVRELFTVAAEQMDLVMAHLEAACLSPLQKKEYVGHRPPHTIPTLPPPILPPHSPILWCTMVGIGY